MKTKVGYLLHDAWKDLRLWFRLIRERRWKFLRFAMRRFARGITTLYCRQCGRLNWYSTSSVCAKCGLYNIWKAIFQEHAA